MPHIQFDINQTIARPEKIALTRQTQHLFARIMVTGTDHISISIRECGTFNLSLGKVEQPELGIALVNADIRAGRTLEQRRALSLGLMEVIHTALKIPKEHMYVTLTEHPGEDFHLLERYLASWQQGEDPLKD
jgi:phenylpyruvate tautomerase PptA (4-oxalocrotonate tautomerase family)